MDLFRGLPVTLNSSLVTYEPREAERTWFERLFTRPWRPFLRTRCWMEAVPSRQVLRFRDGFLMHPETWRTLKSIAEVADSAHP